MRVLLCLLGILSISTSKKLPLYVSEQDCPGTLCPGGCCIEQNWYCCSEFYCAATAADCAFVATKQTLIKMAAKKDCPGATDCDGGCCDSPDPCPGGTMCPGGCCPEPNWYCCPELYCAATATDCAFGTTKQTLIKMAAKKDCPGGTDCNGGCCQDPCPGGTMCPGGCCPEPNWYCCPEFYCAATAADCAFVTAKQSLIKMAAKKDCPGGTECNGKCCLDYCCPYGTWPRCRASAGHCQYCPGGTLCPGGCCPEPNWYCCPDTTGVYWCAATAADCAFGATKQTLIKMAAKELP